MRYQYTQLLCMALSLVILPSIAKDTKIFDQYKIELPFYVNHSVLAADVLADEGVELLIAGVDEKQQRILGIYGFDTLNKTFIKHDLILIDQGVFAFDVGEKNAQGRQAIYLLSKNSVEVYVPPHLSQASTLKQEQVVTSMFLADIADSFTNIDFAKDVNDDDIDDLVLPHFEQLNLWLSDCCGARHHQSLPIAARLEVQGSSVVFDDIKLYFQDMGQDSKTDLVTIEKGILKVFNQKSDMQFDSQASIITIAPDIYGLNWWNIKGPTGQDLDQSDIKHRKIVKMQDINADNIPDLAVEFNQSSGVLDKVIDYEFFYGKVVEGKLTYSAQADASLAMDQTLSDLRLIDIDGDSKPEIVASSFDIGVSQIIGAILSGSIDQNMMVFAMDENEQLSKKPLVEQDVEITFSLSSGSSGEPLARVVDINGDGIKDLIFSDGDDRIRALLATPKGKKPYAKRSLKQNVIMPKDASKAAAEDLNADGKTDFVLNFDRTDGLTLQKQVLVLMTK